MINLLYIDLFCGAGGTSTGVNEARLHGEQCARVIACVNHDPNAIASHAANQIDWEQRLYETAKDITCAYCMSVGVGNSSETTEKVEIINASVDMAKMLISKLQTIHKK